MLRVLIVVLLMGMVSPAMAQERGTTTPEKKSTVQPAKPTVNPAKPVVRKRTQRPNARAVRGQGQESPSLQGVQAEQAPGEAGEGETKKKKKFSLRGIGKAIDGGIGLGLGVATLAVIAVPTAVAAGNVFQ
ncbi:MAG: hypothetical protein AAGB22_07060 [Bacteroidota bacterium]